MKLTHKNAKKTVLLSVALLAGFLVCCFIIQIASAVVRTNACAERFFDSVSETTAKQQDVAESLISSREEIVRKLANGLSAYYEGDVFDRAMSRPAEEQCGTLRQLCAVSDIDILMIVDTSWNVVFSSREPDIGTNIVEAGFITEDDISILEQKEADIASSDSLLVYSADPYAPDDLYALLSSPLNVGNEIYHALSFSDMRTFISEYMFVYNDRYMLDTISSREFTALIMRGAEEYGETGSTFSYCMYDGTDYSGKPISELGISESVMSDGYFGIQKINGHHYMCRSRNFNDAGDGAMLLFASDVSMATDFSSMIWSFVLLLLLYFHIFRYGLQLRRDAIDMESKHRYGYITGRLMQVALLGSILVFALTFYVQTLSGLSSAIQKAGPGQELLSDTITSAVEMQEMMNSAEEEICLSQASLIKMRIDAQPAEYFSTHNADRMREYAITGEGGASVPIPDDFAHALTSVSESDMLNGLCRSFDFSRITLYNSDGYIVADSGKKWYGKIERGSEESGALFDVLDRKVDSDYSVFSHNGGVTLRTALPVEYYIGNDNGKTVYLNREEYLAAKEQDPDPAAVLGRYGLLVCEQLLPEKHFASGKDALDFVIASREKVQDCEFLILRDDGQKDVVFSHFGADTAAELSLPDGVLDAGFNNYISFKGEKYFACTRDITNEKLGDLLVITLYPNSSLHDWRLPVSLAMTIGSMLALVWLSLLIGTAQNGLTSYMAGISANIPVWGKKDNYTFDAFVIAIAAVASIAIAGDAWKDSVVFYIVFGEWKHGLNMFSLTACLFLAIGLWVCIRLIWLLERSFKVLGARGETFARLTSSVIKYGAVLFMAFYSLYLFGLDTASVLRSLGAFSLIVGLGAQSLIKDIIAGIFIVCEGTYRVGDIVQINGFRGKVMELALRTTKMVDLDGTVKVFNNSTISNVENLSLEVSRVVCDIRVKAQKTPQTVEQLVIAALPDIRERNKDIIIELDYDGIIESNMDSYVIRLTAKCQERYRGILWRKMNREIVAICEKISIGQ